MVAAHMSSREARTRFAELTDRVRYTGEPVVVEKQGRPFVAVVSLDDLAAIEQLRGQARSERARPARRLATPHLIRPPGADPHHFELEMTVEREDAPAPDAAVRRQ